ncbi:MAG TPA: DoxX family protein [Terriglobia bacterium]|jgi:putative oxidoreductase|nr:DoxX family protein [Terriglobia bacterium]
MFGYPTLDKWLAAREEWAPLFLRLSLGLVFLAHGAQKLLGWFGGSGWNGTMQYFTQTLHIPTVFAALVIVLEFFGGAALLAGAFTRWTALLLGIEMVVAALKVHLANGFFMNWANTPNAGHGIEFNVILVGALAALLVMGGGRLSLDAALTRPFNLNEKEEARKAG